MYKFLGEAVYNKHVASAAHSLLAPRLVQTPAEMKKIFKQHAADDDNPPQFETTLETHEYMNLAALYQAGGWKTSRMRHFYHQAALEWEPVVAAMSFAPRAYRTCIGHTPSIHDELKVLGAKVIRDDGEYFAVYKAIPQPLSSDFLRKALLCAAISCDRKLAHRLARSYPLRPLPPKDQDVRYTILRHLLADDDKSAAAAARELRPGYPSDWPPELIEFPLGVVRRDGKLLAAGLKKLNTRFAGRWNLRRWEDRFKRITAGKHPKWNGTWDEMMKDVREFLVSFHWLSSPFAIAYLNVAAWRGMKSPFDQPELFSEWIPLDLCKSPGDVKSKKQ